MSASRKYRRAQDSGNASLLTVFVEPAKLSPIEEINQHRANASDCGWAGGEEDLKGFVGSLLRAAVHFVIGRDCPAALLRRNLVGQGTGVTECGL
jgi:hypothetical protein